MKNLKSILTMGLLFVSTAGFAQFANNGGHSRGGSVLTKNTDGYSRIYFGYNPTSVSYDGKTDDSDVEDFTLNGIMFGYTKGISLSQNMPLFLETGARFTYGFKSQTLSSEDEEDDETVDTKAMNIVVPINLSYKFSFSESDFSVSPFVGVTLKGNVLGKQKWSDEDDDFEYDFFDKEDMGGKDNTWKRFQVGWQIGANVDYKSLSVGMHYGSDFSELAKKTNSSNWAITLGYSF